MWRITKVTLASFSLGSIVLALLFIPPIVSEPSTGGISGLVGPILFGMTVLFMAEALLWLAASFMAAGKALGRRMLLGLCIYLGISRLALGLFLFGGTSSLVGSTLALLYIGLVAVTLVVICTNLLSWYGR